MAWPAVKRAFSPSAFKAYVDGLTWDGGFRPQFIALHNTAAPSLAQRPAGLTFNHIKNLESYYRDTRNWNGGPHLFVDDKQIWVLNDLTKIGVHSPSWNRVALGIEMLGDYDTESFTEGRGAKVRANTVAAMAILNNRLGFAADGFKFHIEDKKSNHACPGKNARAEREALVAEIDAAMSELVVTPTAEVAITDTNVRITHGALAHESHHAADEPAELQEQKSSFWDNWSFARINQLADEGSRTAGYLKTAKNWLLWRIVGGTAAAGGAATAVGGKTGTGRTIAADPMLLGLVLGLGLGAVVVGLLAYWFLKKIEASFAAAAKEARYRPRGA